MSKSNQKDNFQLFREYLLVVKYFTVKDSTGEIIAVTERIFPKKGEKVRVKGRMIEAFSLGDKTLTVFQEERD